MKNLPSIQKSLRAAEQALLTEFPRLLAQHKIVLPQDEAFTVLSIGCGDQPVELETIARQYEQASLIGIEISENSVQAFQAKRKEFYHDRIQMIHDDATDPTVYATIKPEAVKLIFFRHPEVFHNSYETIMKIFQLLLARFPQAQIFVSCHYPHEAAILNYVLQNRPLPPIVLKTPGTLIVENPTGKTQFDQYSFAFPAATTQVNLARHQRVCDEFLEIATKLSQLEPQVDQANVAFVQQNFQSLYTVDKKGEPIQLSKLKLSFRDAVACTSKSNEFQRGIMYQRINPFLRKLSTRFDSVCVTMKELLEPQCILNATEFVIANRQEVENSCQTNHLLLLFEPVILVKKASHKELVKTLSKESVTEYAEIGRPVALKINCLPNYIRIDLEAEQSDLRLVASTKESALNPREKALLKTEAKDISECANGFFYRNRTGQITLLTTKFASSQAAGAAKAKIKALDFNRKVKITKHATEQSFYCALFFPTVDDTQQFLQRFRGADFETRDAQQIREFVLYRDCLKQHTRNSKGHPVERPLTLLIKLLARDLATAANFHVLVLEWLCLQQFSAETALQQHYKTRLQSINIAEYPELESAESLKAALEQWHFKSVFPELLNTQHLEDFLELVKLGASRSFEIKK